MTCPQCKKDRPKLTCTWDKENKEVFWACEKCRGSGVPGHVYTGRKIWTGDEVYGKRIGSDELRADTESAMLGGSGKGLKG